MNRLLTLLLTAGLVAGSMAEFDYSRDLGKKDDIYYGKKDYDKKKKNSCPSPAHPFTGPWAKNYDGGKKGGYVFNRIVTHPVCKAEQVTCDIDDEISAEIIDVTPDGKTIVFTNSPGDSIGLVDISDPYHPVSKPLVDVGGEPTSARILGNRWVLVGVNTSPDFVNPSGELLVMDLKDDLAVYMTFDLGGQPDAVAVSPDGKYVAIAIENERDEDLEDGGLDGGLPQLPAGFLVIIDSYKADPNDWTMHVVDLTGLDGLDAPQDPEPEYVDFNHLNEVVVSLQENNAIVIVDAETKTVKTSFSAGYIDLEHIDTEEEGIISFETDQFGRVREPDAVAWVDNYYFFTADEGDWKGGSRSVTLFDKNGNVISDTGSSLDYIVAAHGHYPDERSGNKGNEPETVYVDTFHGTKYLFTVSERSNLLIISELDKYNMPWFTQAIPAGVRPEGIVAIPHRDLLVVASEVDDRGDKIRASLTIYKYTDDEPTYPMILSAANSSKPSVPIPYGALSGLAVDPHCPSLLYSIEDSFYSSNRFFKIDASQKPAVLFEGTRLMDTQGKLAAYANRCGCFTDNPVNPDMTVNIDPEGIDVFDDGTILIVSEGDTREDRLKPNYVLGVHPSGVIVDIWELPEEWLNKQKRWGFEGVAIDPNQEMVVVAGQVPWGEGSGASPSTGDDEGPALHIFINGKHAGYVFYPLDEPESQNGGWVGIGDLSALGNKKFAVLERDNQGGLDAAIKRVYTIDLNGWYDGKVVEKTRWADIIDELADSTNGPVPEKVEGLACLNGGEVCWVNTDNDGVDDANGENLLLPVYPH